MTENTSQKGSPSDIVSLVWPKVRSAYQSVMGNPCPVGVGDLKVAVSTKGILPGKIGRHIGPKDGYDDGSILIIHPRAVEVSEPYLKVVIAHELTHFALSHDKVKPHGSEFNSIAVVLGIPEKFRD